MYGYTADQMHAYAAQEVAKAVAALSKDAERYQLIRRGLCRLDGVLRRPLRRYSPCNRPRSRSNGR
jgi:hypothetical protein